MGMDWLGYNIGIVWKIGKNASVAIVQVNYLAYVEMNTPKCSFFCSLTRKTYSLTTLAT
jgi:hypothetical protein